MNDLNFRLVASLLRVLNRFQLKSNWVNFRLVPGPLRCLLERLSGGLSFQVFRAQSRA